jgi:AcrR family transcriptional regulator
VPTGVALANARELLFDAAERVLGREGASGLTSRAVTTEAGVAKGVMHRHFDDFDAFLAELVLDRVARLAGPAQRLRDAVGTRSVVENLAEAVTAVFGPLAVVMVALVITREGLRGRLREAGAAPLPLVAEASAMVTAYLAAEQASGRVVPTADVETLGPTLVGAAHLLFTDREAGAPEPEDVRKVIAAVMHGLSTDDPRPSGS